MKNLLTSLFLVLCTAQLGMALVRSPKGELTVLARGPAGLRIEGKSAEVSVDDETSALVFRSPLAALDTGIPLRNRHLRESLEAEKFPIATLRVPRTELAFPAGSASKGSARAELTLHGQTHPVTVTYRAEREVDVTRVVGSLQFDMRDFGIHVPSYLGLTVAPEVDVQAEMAVELP